MTYQLADIKDQRFEVFDVQIIQAFHQLPLPVQARLAADALEKIHERRQYVPPEQYTPAELRKLADRWVREDVMQAEIDELAQHLALSAGYANPDKRAFDRASDLYSAGYRKVQAS